MSLITEYEDLLEKQAIWGLAARGAISGIKAGMKGGLKAGLWTGKKAGNFYVGGIKDFAKNPVKTVATNLAVGEGINLAAKSMAPAAQNTAKRAAPLMNSAANASQQLGQQALTR